MTIKQLLIIILITLSVSCQAEKKQKKSTPLQPANRIAAFDFGSGKVKEGFQAVTASTWYSAETGFGLVSAKPVTDIDRQGKDSLLSDFITSDQPFYFQIDLPEGNYRVRISLGDLKGQSLTTVKAESRRLMLEKIATENGNLLVREFDVNVRTPRINDSTKIKLKPRELNYLNWDNKLTLEFSDKRPCVAGIEIFRIDSEPVIFLAGNSTVVDQEEEPWASWGQMFPRFLKPGVVVANFAESGEALRSFKGERRLEKILSLMKPGDYLFIEFAHNDQKKGGSYVEPFTTYTDEVRYFINKAREKGGQPVLVTSMHRRNFDANGQIINTLETYPDAMRKIAAEENLPLVDLNAMSKILYETLGPENSKLAFVHYPAGTFPGQEKELADNTHFSNYGAVQLAKCVAQSLRLGTSGLAGYIIDDFSGYDPSHPDDPAAFDLPASLASNALKPDGN